MSEDLFTSGNATLYVTDLDRSVRFYSETLGLGLTFRRAGYFLAGPLL